MVIMTYAPGENCAAASLPHPHGETIALVDHLYLFPRFSIMINSMGFRVGADILGAVGSVKVRIHGNKTSDYFDYYVFYCI